MRLTGSYSTSEKSDSCSVADCPTCKALQKSIPYSCRRASISLTDKDSSSTIILFRSTSLMLSWSFCPSVDIFAASRLFIFEELTCVLSVDLVNRISAESGQGFESFDVRFRLRGKNLKITGSHKVTIMRPHAHCHANRHRPKILLKIPHRA